MWTKKAARLIATGIIGMWAVLALAPESWGAGGMAVDLGAAESGQIVPGGGWTSTMAENNGNGGIYDGSPQYVAVDPAWVSPGSGAFRAVLKRGDDGEDGGLLDYECVVAFLAGGQRLVTFDILWNADVNGTTGTFVHAGGIENAKRNKLWPSFTPLGREVSRGGRLELLFTWDESGGELYVDGRKIGLDYNTTKYTGTGAPKTFGEQLVGLDQVAIGLEPSDGYAWDPANDTIILEAEFFGSASDAFDTTPPEPVARVLAEPGFGGEIVVGWTPSASADVDHYEIFRAEGAAPATTGTPLQTTALLEYTDAGLVSGARYFYRVVAVDKAGNRSAASEAADAVAPAGEGPRIASVTVEPADKPLRPGDVLTVTVTGQSGGRGLADIQGLMADLVLTEAKGTGTYTGTLAITEAEVANERQALQVVGKLSDDYGASRQAGPEITIVSAADLNDKTPPAIDDVTHDGFRVAGFSGKLVAGDTLTVTLAGETGGYATFRLADVTEPQSMAETAPGVYTGSYTVGWDDEGEGVAVEATLADFAGNPATAVAAKTVDIDTRVRLVVTARESMLPADRESKTRVAVRAEDANGDGVEGHELALTLSTTSEYTGVVGGGKVEDKFAAKDDVDDIEVKWDGVTDSFGELAATYTAGFAAKTALILAKDLTTGDVGAGWVNTYVASTVAFELLPRAAREAADMAQMTMSVTPSWLTADGRSKARVKVRLTDFGGAPVAGAVVGFSMEGGNGSVKVLRGVTDAAGLAEAEYRAGTVAGFVALTASAEAYQVTRTMQVELRSDAPAKIDLVASAVSLPADGRTSAEITAVVSDINDNRNPNVPVMFSVLAGGGSVAPARADTDDDGVVGATYTAGDRPGMAVVEARHTSRAPTDEELRRVYGTVFVPRLYEDQEGDRVRVSKWLVEDGDTVEKDQPLAILDADDTTYTLAAPEAGVFSRVVRHARDPVTLGETIGYVEIDAEVWDEEYAR